MVSLFLVRSAQTFFKTLPVTFSPIVSTFNIKTDNGEITILFWMPIWTFLIAAAILYTTFVPSLSLEESDHGGKTYNREHVSVKPGRGIVAQQKALTFETPFFDEAQGIIARILALLTDTILFSRRVIDVQNMLLNMTSPSTKNKTKQRTTATTDRCFQRSTAVWPSPIA